MILGHVSRRVPASSDERAAGGKQVNVYMDKKSILLILAKRGGRNGRIDVGLQQ
jgi:hypothetical protein